MYLGIFTMFYNLTGFVWSTLWCYEPAHSNQLDCWKRGFQKADMQTNFSLRPIDDCFFGSGTGFESLTLLPRHSIPLHSMWYFSVPSTKIKHNIWFQQVYKVLLNCCQYLITKLHWCTFGSSYLFKQRKNSIWHPLWIIWDILGLTPVRRVLISLYE